MICHAADRDGLTPQVLHNPTNVGMGARPQFPVKEIRISGQEQLDLDAAAAKNGDAEEPLPLLDKASA